MLPWTDTLLRLGAAVACGLALGLEREWKEKPAGLRTQALVALAAASFTVLALEIFHAQKAMTDETAVDMTRVIEGVIAGVAFLGAGTIIKSGRDVKGLTTGATIWVAGALGVACGGGWYVPAAITLALALAIAHLLLGVEWMVRRAAGPAPEAKTDRRAER